MRTLSPEAQEKAQSNRKAKNEEIATARKNKITIAGWNIYRYDMYNVDLQHGDTSEVWYYPTITDALKALHEKLIVEKLPDSKDTLKSIQLLIKAIESSEKRIVEALAKHKISV